MTENPFCNTCHVAYVEGYAGPCTEPAPHASDFQLASGDYPRCRGTVSLDATVQMQRQRAEEAEAERERLRDTIQRVLDLRSSYEADRGNDVLLVGNLQARGMLSDALRSQTGLQ